MDVLNILQLHPGSTFEEAKNNFKKLSKKFHPDKNPNDPNAVKNFQIILEAFESIKEEPSLLKPLRKNSNVSNFIQTDTTISLKDIYLRKSIDVDIERYIICKNCSGTGTQDKELGICPHCEGVGSINSKVLKLMGKNNICPFCGGSGIKSGNLCRVCLGKKVQKQIKTLTLDLDTNFYYKRIAVFKNEGNEIKNKGFGDVHINLIIKCPDNIFLKDNQFTMYDTISPVQNIIGGISILNVFDKNIKYKIPKNKNDIFLEDSRPDMRGRRKIHVFFNIVKKRLTPETKKFYTEIEKLEKNIDFQEFSV